MQPVRIRCLGASVPLSLPSSITFTNITKLSRATLHVVVRAEWPKAFAFNKMPLRVIVCLNYHYSMFL